jgi:hypothetical protein
MISTGLITDAGEKKHKSTTEGVRDSHIRILRWSSLFDYPVQFDVGTNGAAEGRVFCDPLEPNG